MPFHLGSNSKAFTSAIAFKCIDSGYFTLQTKFVDVFPELKDSMLEVYRFITISDLLSHQARVRAYTSGSEFINLPAFNGSVSDKRCSFAKFVLKQSPVKSGTYSNANLCSDGSEFLKKLQANRTSNFYFNSVNP
ncbi:MAG: serine hydrolase domain-containing protein [Bacteroidia bacterium]